MKRQYRYKTDPIDTAEFLFVQEFLDKTPDRSIKVSELGPDGQWHTTAETPIGDDVLCDLCNAALRPIDPCVLTNDATRLYCWTCASTWIIPYLLPEAPR